MARQRLSKGIILLFLATFFLPFSAYSKSSGPPIFTTGFIVYIALILISIPFLFVKKNRVFRFLILFFSLAYIGFLQNACPSPVGAIEILALKGDIFGKNLRHLIKVLVVIVPAFFFGKYFCGWICPKGAIQELLFQKKVEIKVPYKLDRILKYLKYVILVLLIALPILFKYKFMREFGPFKVIFNLDGSTFLVIFLAFILILSIFINRPYCRYFCPLGALLGIINKISLFKIRLSKTRCVSCGICARDCPTDAIVHERKDKKLNTRIEGAECIVCTECLKGCTKNAIHFSIRDK